MNALLVFMGGIVGSYVGVYFPKSLKTAITHAFGIFSFGLAYHLFKEGAHANLMWVLFCIMVGGGIGYLFDFENILNKYVSKAFKNIAPDGFIDATILFCVGPVTILGCILEGTRGQNSIILSKAIMDGISSILLASSLGRSVAFSSFSILFYQGVLTYMSFFLKSFINQNSLNIVSFVGATLIIALGLKLLGISKDIKLLNFILSPVLGLFIR